VVNAGPGVVDAAQKLGDVEKIFERPRWTVKDLGRWLRVHQWAKNVLLLVPLIGAHRWTDPAKLFQAAIAFVAFCLCASSVYLLNDLMDLESDRRHHRKQHRPMAAGRISLVWGLVGAPLLLLAGAGAAWTLGPGFAATMAAYYALTLLYSLRLKQVAILDVVTLASLYAIRVIAGGMATALVVTDWLLVFSMFLFVSLAFAKRFTELQWARGERQDNLSGRGYRTSDADLISSMGVGSGYLSVLVLAFYVTSHEVTQLYHRPAALWLACPVLLYWISRVWLLAHRRSLHDDPVIFALKDGQSWIICLIILAIAAVAGPIHTL
jgi:4-hydroxybenzoate polyprenyltransferase